MNGDVGGMFRRIVTHSDSNVRVALHRVIHSIVPTKHLNRTLIEHGGDECPLTMTKAVTTASFPRLLSRPIADVASPFAHGPDAYGLRPRLPPPLDMVALRCEYSHEHRAGPPATLS